MICSRHCDDDDLCIRERKKCFLQILFWLQKINTATAAERWEKKEKFNVIYISYEKSASLASYWFSSEYIEYYSCQASAQINEISIWYHDLPASTIALRSSKSPPLLHRLVLPNNKRRKKTSIKFSSCCLCEKRWGPRQMRREYVIILPSNLNSKKNFLIFDHSSNSCSTLIFFFYTYRKSFSLLENSPHLFYSIMLYMFSWWCPDTGPSVPGLWARFSHLLLIIINADIERKKRWGEFRRAQVNYNLKLYLSSCVCDTHITYSSYNIHQKLFSFHNRTATDRKRAQMNRNRWSFGREFSNWVISLRPALLGWLSENLFYSTWNIPTFF